MQQEERESTCYFRWRSGPLERPTHGRRVDDRKRDRYVEAGPHVRELAGRRRCRHCIAEARLPVGVLPGRMVGAVGVVVTGLDVGRQLAHVTENQNRHEQWEEPEGEWNATSEAPH